MSAVIEVQHLHKSYGRTAAVSDISLSVQAATALARESLSEARRSVHALRPGSLETEQLGDALAALRSRPGSRSARPRLPRPAHDRARA